MSDGGVRCGPPQADEMVQWTISSAERRELRRAAGELPAKSTYAFTPQMPRHLS
jgi:hypothetical protein